MPQAWAVPPILAVPPVPAPDPDPQKLYRALPTGGRRTSVWFGVIGAVILILGLPFAVPVNRDVVDGSYDSLGDAAADTLLTWGSWSPDLTGWDRSCAAPRMQPGMAGLYADCGSYTVELVGTDGVDPDRGESVVAGAADRAVRAAWAQDQEPMEFRAAGAVRDVFAASLAPDIATVLFSEIFEYTYDDDTPGAPGDGFGDFGENFGGGLQDVSVGGVSAEPAAHTDYRTVSGRSFTRAAAFVRNSDDHTMYTVIVSGRDPQRVQTGLSGLLKELR